MTSSDRDRRRIDVNADVGEGQGDDALIRLVTSANIACGGHAGDEDSMRRTAASAMAGGVAIGAHPSFPDRERFGRVSIPMPPGALGAEVGRQISSLVRVVEALGGRVVHVKPHGALYNDAAGDPILARAVASGVAGVSRDLVLVGLAGSIALPVWRAMGFAVASEGFADRAYRDDGTLAPRSQQGAVLSDPAEAAAQAVRLARAGGVDTIGVHSDTPGAAAIAAAVVSALAEAGFTPVSIVPRRRPR